MIEPPFAAGLTAAMRPFEEQLKADGVVIARLMVEKDRLIGIVGDAWSALRMIREVIEQQSVGALPAEEAVTGMIGPTLLHEAAVLVEGISKLAAERDEWRAKAANLSGIEDGYAQMVGQRDAALARVAELETAVLDLSDKDCANRRRIAELETALSPFADEMYTRNGDEAGRISHREDNELVWIEHDLTAGDFRRARDAVKGKS